jgi:translation initiation factor IF-2
MYRSLQQEFSGDKAAKMKSDQLELPKGTQAEAKKKKEDEEISFKKEEKLTPKIVKKEEVIKPVEEVIPAPIVEIKVEEAKEEVTNIEAPEIERPKVVTKIDLSTIDSSTRPKKIIKGKKEDLPAEAEAIKPAEDDKLNKGKPKKGKKEDAPLVIEKKTSETPVTPQIVADDQPAVIENIEVEKLTGPKILGKIDLPVDNDTRPVKEEKKKRKRIPIEKKDTGRREIFINKDTGGDRRQGAGATGGGPNFNRGRGGNTGGPNRGWRRCRSSH